MARIDFLDDVKCSSSAGCELYGSYDWCACSSSETLVSVNWIVQCIVHQVRISSCEVSGSYLIDLWMAMLIQFIGWWWLPRQSILSYS